MAENGEFDIGAAKPSFDYATVTGLVGGFGLILTAIFIGGSPESFFNLPSVLIVIGGTLAVTTICFSFAEIGRTAQVIVKTFSYSKREPAEAATQILEISQMARREGVLSLQKILEPLQSEPFLYKGVSMVVDGTPSGEVENILRRDVQATFQRHLRSANVLRRAAEFSPAMGLIGTLIGLVQMLGNLDDPTTIGPSMAIALLTTFYGAVLANMVFIPLASKLERNSTHEEMINGLYLTGTVSIGRQETPRRLEMLLNSTMPPAQRIQFFE